jgi:hypothetical protein
VKGHLLTLASTEHGISFMSELGSETPPPLLPKKTLRPLTSPKLELEPSISFETKEELKNVSETFKEDHKKRSEFLLKTLKNAQPKKESPLKEEEEGTKETPKKSFPKYLAQTFQESKGENPPSY